MHFISLYLVCSLPLVVCSFVSFAFDNGLCGSECCVKWPNERFEYFPCTQRFERQQKHKTHYLIKRIIVLSLWLLKIFFGAVGHLKLFCI